MKAYRTLGDGIDALELSEVPAPEAKADEILVKMTAASLNYRDLLVIKGIDKWKTDAPRIPVSDGVGEVVAVGKDVAKWKKGDRVAGIFLPKWLDGELTDENGVAPLGGKSADGVLAECVIFNQESVVKIPQNLTDAEASTLP
ncbi:MAG: alcohol dehydrogenase catalytic domain-containing protein, partial [Acidobacteriota bacterium]|nr:alcohol dehydrogenase catalytic domain-containing protein [Acidobacteriota bacterium]